MISYVRTDEAGKQVVVIVNFAPVAWEGCVIGVPDASSYTVALSSDEARFGGSGKDPGRLKVDKKTPCHDFQQSITLDVPPMSALYLVGRPRPKRAPKAAEKAPKTTAKAEKAKAEADAYWDSVYRRLRQFCQSREELKALLLEKSAPLPEAWDNGGN